jgi:release factor glutamine methyltransferase
VTLRDAIAAAATRLSEQADLGNNAEQDAELLLLYVIGAARTVLFTDGDRELPSAELATYDALIARRQAGEPIQYILGEQEFYGLPFKVTSAVLIPRPETELLVEAALERLPKDRPLRIADVGTGSGAIAIAIAHHLPLATVTALDLSEAALAVAQENAQRLGLDQRVRFVRTDLLAGIEGEELFDAVLSNPPYIPESDREDLHRQVREFEPGLALFGGADGMDIYRKLIPAASKVLKPGGLLAIEIGYGQRLAIEKLLLGWSGLEVLDDLKGIPRAVLARTRGSSSR